MSAPLALTAELRAQRRAGRWRQRTCGLALSALAALCTPAAAAPPSPRAQSLRTAGLRALAAGDLGAAARELEAAYRLLPDGEGLFLLARLAWAEGRTLLAQDLAQRSLVETNAAGAVVITAKDWAKLRQVRPDAWPCPVVVAELDLQFDRGWEALQQMLLEARVPPETEE